MKENNELLVEVRQVSKKFSRDLKRSLWYGLLDIGRVLIGKNSPADHLRKGEFWAVKDMSFSLRRGECIGLIGHNGAGKSTLLKMLNGLIKPDRGTIIMRGKVGALIELGAGFNPLLTGRENIYINGQLLGFSKREVESKIDAILDFAEIGEFIDSPVQNYSSGMKVRLGFAIAAQMEPDVLIVDEVLAVGDLGFVLKCFNVIDKILPKTAVIFVSHSMPMVSRICTDIILMQKGEIRFKGKDISQGIDLYYSNFSLGPQTSFLKDEMAEFIRSEVHSSEVINGLPVINWLDDLKITFTFKVRKEIVSPVISLFFLNKEQHPIGVCSNEDVNNSSISNFEENGWRVISTTIILEKVQFSQGLYYITFGLSEEVSRKPVLRVRNAVVFQVSSKRHVWHSLDFNGKWIGTKEVNIVAK